VCSVLLLSVGLVSLVYGKDCVVKILNSTCLAMVKVRAPIRDMHLFNGYEFDDALTCKGASVPEVWACGVARDWLSLTYLHIQAPLATLGGSMRMRNTAYISRHTSA
jgi:hypothetical protein